MEIKDYNLTCGEVIDNLLTLADAYEKASAGKAPNGFAFNPTDAAANMKAAVHFIGSFGQQLPRWIPVEERMPVDGYIVVGYATPDTIDVAEFHAEDGRFWCLGGGWFKATHWMPLPESPT